MLNRVRGKRVALGALGVALAAMLAVGVALGVGQRGDGRPATWVTGMIGDGEDIGFGEPFGPGNYRMPLREITGEDTVLVFAVPAGLRLDAWVDTPECHAVRCPGLGPVLTLHGAGFWFGLDLATVEERWRGYSIDRRPGDAIDEYGYPLRCGGREGCRASDDRPAKYDPLIDKVVASARIESAR